MSLGYLWISALVALVLLAAVWYRLGYGIVRLTRRWLRLLAQVTSTVLGAQIVGIVFFVSTLQQHDSPADGDYLTNAARNLTYGALISIAGLLLMVLFAASVQRRRRPPAGPARVASRTEKLTMASAVVAMAFVGLVHLALMLPLILLDPLL